MSTYRDSANVPYTTAERFPAHRAGRHRRRTRLLRLGALLLASAAAFVAFSQPAASQSNGLSLNPGDLLGVGLGETVSSLACDPARTLTVPLGELAAAVSALVCNADLLDYTVYTVFRRPDGSEVAREFRAIIGLPTLLNVDDDFLPDLLATVQPRSATRFGIHIQRLPLLTAWKALPVSVEIVANDPTKGSLPRERLAFGYDARSSRAPEVFQSEITVGTSAAETGGATVGIGWAATGAGADLAVTGGLFDGPPSARANPVRARLAYTPVPSKAGIDLVISETFGARLTTAQPTVLTLDAESVAGSEALDVHAVVNRLPAETELTYSATVSAERTVNYWASSRIERFELDYRALQAGTLTDHAVVTAHGIPRQLSFAQTGPKTANLTTSGGPIDLVEAGFANGEVRLLPAAADAYAYILDQGGVQSFAGRVAHLTRASFDGRGPIAVDAEVTARSPFDFVLDQPDLKATAQLLDLPHRTLATIDLTNGRLEFDGFGEGVGRVTLDATSTTPFFERVQRIVGHADGLASKVGVHFKPAAGGSASITASEPVDLVELLLTSGPTRALRDPRAGLLVEDTPGTFAVAVRLFGLRSVTFSPGAEMRAAGLVRAGPFTLEYLNPDLHLRGEVLDLPGELDLKVAPRETRFELGGPPGAAEIGRVSFDLRTTAPLVATANLLRIAVDGVPRPLVVTFTPRGEGGAVDASQPLRRVSALLSSGIEPDAGGDPNDIEQSNVYLQAIDAGSCCSPGTFAVAARINGFKRMDIDVSPERMNMALDLAGPQRFHATGKVNDAHDAVAGEGLINLDVDRLPTHASLTVAYKSGFEWIANDGVGSITITGENLPGSQAFGAPHFLRARLLGVPTSIHVTTTDLPGYGVFFATAPIGEIELDIADEPGRFGAGGLPSDRNTVRLRTGKLGLEAHVRAFDVQRGLVGMISSGDYLTASTEFGGPPKGIDVFFDRTSATNHDDKRQHVEVHVPQPPRKIDLSVTTGDHTNRLQYTASGEFPEVSLKALTAKPAGDPRELDQSAIEVFVRDLPPSLTFCYDDSIAGCDAKAPVQYVVDPGVFKDRVLITQFNDLTTFLQTQGATKRVNLVRLYSCHGTSARDRDPLVDTCLTRGDQFDFFKITNLRAKQFRFEHADSESRERDGDKPVEDDLLKLYIDTDPSGINVEHLETWKRERDKRTQVIANNLGSPVVAEDFFAVIDHTPPANYETVSGSLQCDHIEIRTAVFLLGTIDVEPLLPICD